MPLQLLTVELEHILSICYLLFIFFNFKLELSKQLKQYNTLFTFFINNLSYKLNSIIPLLVKITG